MSNALRPVIKSDGAPGLLANEFAAAIVSVDYSAHGPRLKLEDMRGERVRYLDPLEVEGLVWAPAHLLEQLVDPSLRWREVDG